MRLAALEIDNQPFQLAGQLVGIAHRPARAIGKRIDEIEEDGDDIAFKATITTEDGRQVGGETSGRRERFRIYRGHFDDHLAPDPDRERRDHHKKRALIECVWGWAITCHKSQGSQFENVVVFDDGLVRTSCSACLLVLLAWSSRSQDSTAAAST
jgi:hypothetical protein